MGDSWSPLNLHIWTLRYCIDLKIGTWPYHFRKRKHNHKSRKYHSAVWTTLILYKNPPVPDLYSNNRNTIDMNFVFKRLQPLHYWSRRREPSISINSINPLQLLYYLSINLFDFVIFYYLIRLMILNKIINEAYWLCGTFAAFMRWFLPLASLHLMFPIPLMFPL